MNKRSLILIILFIPGIFFSREYRYNSSQLRTLLNTTSVTLSMIPYNSLWYPGCSLLETLPLMEEVYRIEICTDNKTYVIEEDDLAEYWGESYFLQDGEVPDLLFLGELYQDIKEICFQGIPMESTDLEIWLGWEGMNELKDEISRLAEKHGLSIHALEVPRPESKLISVLRARGKIPDLVMLQSSAVESLVQSRAVQNLDYIRLPDLLSQGKDAFTLKEKLWGIPFYFDTQIIFFNKTLITHPPTGEWTLE